MKSGRILEVTLSLFALASATTLSSAQTSRDLSSIARADPNLDRCPLRGELVEYRELDGIEICRGPHDACQQGEPFSKSTHEACDQASECYDDVWDQNRGIRDYNKYIRGCRAKSEPKRPSIATDSTLTSRQPTASKSQGLDDLSSQLDSALKSAANRARGAAQENAASLDQLNKEFDAAVTEKSSEYMRLEDQRRQVELELKRNQEYRARLKAQIQNEKRRQVYLQLQRQRQLADSAYYRKVQQRQQVMQMLNIAAGMVNTFYARPAYQPSARSNAYSNGSFNPYGDPRGQEGWYDQYNAGRGGGASKPSYQPSYPSAPSYPTPTFNGGGVTRTCPPTCAIK
ncbi:hypothetical protein NKH36_00075 [Mesorhizobium sp. M1312]|uniref:hypothetical protein n=1 Tax=unclassified Mesorhizobium TaxID=325217 RepID=UPI003338B368